MQKKINTTPFFIFLLPLFFIANGYNDFFGFFSIRYVLINLFFTIFSIAGIFLLFKLFFSDQTKTAIGTFFFCCFLIFFGFIHDAIKYYAPFHFLGSYTFLIPFFIVVLYTAAYLLKQGAYEFKRLFVYLNLLFFILFFLEAFRFVVKFRNADHKSLLIDSRFNVDQQFKASASLPDSLKPDIFLLVFDGMPSSKALMNDLSFNNSELDSFLLCKGFYIAANAKSNYDLTVLSMSSMLNMDYIPEEEIFRQTGIHMYYRSTSSLLDNSLVRILKRQGYLIHQYQPLSLFNNEDWKGDRVFRHMLSMNYLYKTFPGRLYRDLGWNLDNADAMQGLKGKRYNNLSKKTANDINMLSQYIKGTCKKSGVPKFIYGHFMLPHEPLIFRSNGSIRPFEEQNVQKTNPKKGKEFFAEQIKYADLKIKDLVSYILSNNKKNTVIIVQGDHGYNSNNGESDFGFRNLNAVYFSDGNYNKMYSNLSPVNTFRIILNKFFASDLPLLKDSSLSLPFTKSKWEK